MKNWTEYEKEIDELEKALEEWRSFFNCDSPHDIEVGSGTLLGKEQARANRAENRVEEQKYALIDLRNRIAQAVRYACYNETEGNRMRDVALGVPLEEPK